jgi:exosortase
VNSTVENIAVVQQFTTTESATRKIQAWQTVVLVGLIGTLYWGILWKLLQQWWTDPNFSHGFFVPLFSAFVVWRNRKNLARVPLRQSWVGLPVVMFALSTLIVGVLGAELFLSRSSLILLLAGLIIYFGGWQLFRAVLFPWLFLFFMVPIPSIVFNQITLPLQFFASKLATDILRALSVPVLREGNIIVLPRMRLEVAEACSGIRSLMSLGTMAIIYGYLADSKFWRRAILALMSIPVAIAANALRLVGTGLTVQYWDPDKGQGFFHEFSGWLIFVVSLAMLFGLHSLIRRIDRSAPKTT